MNPFWGYKAAILLLLIAYSPTLVMAQEELPEETASDDSEETPPVTYESLIDNGEGKVQAHFIGLTGGIIVGAEVVMAVEAALKVKKVWPYVVMPLFGAGAGGVGGYFLEKNSPAGAVALLVVGVALVIPTAIFIKSARAYHPEDDAVGADMEEGAKYSFEKPPEKGTAPKDETQTEVERRPEEAPPPPSGPTSRREIRDSSGRVESPGTYSRNRGRQPDRARSTAIRRATAGSLLFVDRDGTTGLSMPHIDVRQTYLEAEAARPARIALQVYVPLLRVDLP